MRKPLVGAAVGVVFGVVLSWSGMSSPQVIRGALLFEHAYLFLFFGSAVAVAFVGLRLIRLVRARAILTGEPVAWATRRPDRATIVGSVIFGVGWAVSDACPGPIATQIGQGRPWSLLTVAGLVGGILLFRRGEQEAAAAVEPEPAPSGA